MPEIIRENAGNLGAKLREARRVAGLSTRRVVEKLTAQGWSISHATIANYERARTIPTLVMLTALAELYSVSINWFLRPGSVLTGVRYRCLKTVGPTQKQKFEANAQRWLEAYRRIEESLHQPLCNQLAGFAVEDCDTGKKVASTLRKRLELGDRPILSVVEILELFGIRVIEIWTKDRIDGLAACLDGEKVVVLNRLLSADRMRLNAAHELGHHLFQDIRNGVSLQPSEVEERAFEFASNFLLPESQLRFALKGLSAIRLLEYKERFGVSMASMIYQAHRANIISTPVYERFWMETAKRKWRTREPGIVLPDRATRFEKMLESAIGSRAISWQQASRITGLREDELRERFSATLNFSGGSNMN